MISGRKVKLNSIMEDDGSYLMKVMLPMYRAARSESGTWWDFAVNLPVN